MCSCDELSGNLRDCTEIKHQTPGPKTFLGMEFKVHSSYNLSAQTGPELSQKVVDNEILQPAVPAIINSVRQEGKDVTAFICFRYDFSFVSERCRPEINEEQISTE